MTLPKLFYFFRPQLSQLSNGDNFKSCFSPVAKAGKTKLRPRELNVWVKILNRKMENNVQCKCCFCKVRACSYGSTGRKKPTFTTEVAKINV